MHFNDNQKAIYKKNLAALKGSVLQKEFAKIKKPTKFKLHFGADALDVNIEDLKTHKFIYENPMQELQDKVALYQQKYLLYPILHFYGLGNGILIKALLQNEHLGCAIVYEKNIELLWLVFHLVDFHAELKKGRLVIFLDKISNADLDMFYNIFKAYSGYLRTFFLEIQSEYYAQIDHEIIINLNKKITDYMISTALKHGNAPTDALEGLQNRERNLARQLTHPSTKELLIKRSGGKTAIIVATGPSLTKQIPTLKKWQKKAHIFAADSAFPILMNNDIVPDYVFMLERTDFTAEFFKHDFKGRDKDTIFIIMDVVHPNALDYLDKFKRKYIIAPRTLPFSYYLHFKDYYYYGGVNVVDLAIYTVALLSYKNALFIGLNLSFADDGSSHPKDYQHSANYESDLYKDKDKYELEAYGGKGKVKTHKFWWYFKGIIEDEIEEIKDTIFYNCTEGGARIKGTKEMPFSEACEKFLKNEADKKFNALENDSKARQDQNLLKAYAKIKKSIVKSDDLIDRCENSLEMLVPLLQDGVNLKQDFAYNKIYFEEAEKIIDEFKNSLKNLYENNHIFETIAPLLHNFDMAMASVFVYNPQNDSEKNKKMFVWVHDHIEYLRQLLGQIQAHKFTLENNIEPLQNELLKRGEIVAQKMKMIDNKDKNAMMFK